MRPSVTPFLPLFLFLFCQASGQDARFPDPTYEDVRYGPYERNVLDLWLAPSERPTPLLIFLHGGGFRRGDKWLYRDSGWVNMMHRNGISTASINYRFSTTHPFPAQMEDCAHAIQFLRYHAKTYNLDPERFAAHGRSAGAWALLWVGFHDDMADAGNSDPVLRQSTRLRALSGRNAQTSMHVPTIAAWFGVPWLTLHPALLPLYGLPADEELVWTPRLDSLTYASSPIAYLTADDPPVFLTFGEGPFPEDSLVGRFDPVDEHTDAQLWVHHPMMGVRLKQAMDSLGVECHVRYPVGHPKWSFFESAELYSFLVEKLLE